MAKLPKVERCVWISTAILDAPEIIALEDHEFKFLLLAAAIQGEQNVFSRYIRFLPPESEN